MIHDPKLARLFNMQKRISVEFYELMLNYLYIAYKIDEYTPQEKVEIVYRTDIAEICGLLKEAGLITDYWYAHVAVDAVYTKSFAGISDEIELQWETETNTERNGEHIQECKTVYGSFADFVEQTKFTLFDATTIASLCELNKITQNQNTVL